MTLTIQSACTVSCDRVIVNSLHYLQHQELVGISPSFLTVFCIKYFSSDLYYAIVTAGERSAKVCNLTDWKWMGWHYRIMPSTHIHLHSSQLEWNTLTWPPPCTQTIAHTFCASLCTCIHAFCFLVLTNCTCNTVAILYQKYLCKQILYTVFARV